VVNALLARSDKTSVATLIQLSTDKAASVRDWATFGLGSQIDVNSPSIRKALADRLDDPDLDTRTEALMGLARRKDPRALEMLKRELVGLEPTSLVFDAAAELRDRSLLPLIEKHRNTVDTATNPGWIAAVCEAHERLSKEET
jgi:HEAT repeat protein